MLSKLLPDEVWVLSTSMPNGHSRTWDPRVLLPAGAVPRGPPTLDSTSAIDRGGSPLSFSFNQPAGNASNHRPDLEGTGPWIYGRGTRCCLHRFLSPSPTTLFSPLALKLRIASTMIRDGQLWSRIQPVHQLRHLSRGGRDQFHTPPLLRPSMWSPDSVNPMPRTSHGLSLCSRCWTSRAVGGLRFGSKCVGHSFGK